MLLLAMDPTMAAALYPAAPSVVSERDRMVFWVSGVLCYKFAFARYNRYLIHLKNGLPRVIEISLDMVTLFGWLIKD
jgi:uncharacterized protein YqgC (DUF456 family)